MASIYELAVRLTATNQVSPVLTTIASQMLGIHQATIKAAGGINNLKTAIAGLGAAFAGSLIVKSLGHVLDHGGKVLNIQNQMLTGSWKMKEIEEATHRARELSLKYTQLSWREILEMQKEMAPVLGDKHHAMEIAEPMAKLMITLQGRLGIEKAGQIHSQVRAAVRSGELSANATDHKRFEAYLEMMGKALNAFNGTVTPQDFMMATKYGRSAALMWSDRFTGTVLPTIIQELGGSSAGTAFMSLHQAVVGGRISRESANWFNQMGLIDQGKLLSVGGEGRWLTPEGRLKKMVPGMFAGASELMSDPDLWMQNYLMKALRTKGYVTDEGMKALEEGAIHDGIGRKTMEKVVEQLTIAFGNRTAQGMAELLALQARKIKRDQQLVTDSFGLTQSVEVWERDYLMLKLALKAQWEGLMDNLALPNLPAAVQGLGALRDVIASISHAIGEHPQFAKVFMSAAFAGGVTLLLGGLVGLAALFVGPMTLAIAGLAALTVGLGAFVALNWDKVKNAGAAVAHGPGEGWIDFIFKGGMFKAFYNFGMWASKAMDQIYDAAVAGIKGLGSKLAGAFTGMFDWLKKMLGFGGSPGGQSLPFGEAVPGIGVDGGQPLFQPQRYVPSGNRGSMIQTRTTIQIDSRVLAEAVAYQIAQMANQVTGPGGFDYRSNPMPADATFT